MKILIIIIIKISNIFKDKFTRVIEFYKIYEVSKTDMINDFTQTKSFKDTPHIIYSNQTIIEQL